MVKEPAPNSVWTYLFKIKLYVVGIGWETKDPDIWKAFTRRFVLDELKSRKLQYCSLEHSNGRCPGCDYTTIGVSYKHWSYSYKYERCAIDMLKALKSIYHIGVGSDVVCSTAIGNARASVRGMDKGWFHAFFMSCRLVEF